MWSICSARNAFHSQWFTCCLYQVTIHYLFISTLRRAVHFFITPRCSELLFINYLFISSLHCVVQNYYLANYWCFMSDTLNFKRKENLLISTNKSRFWQSSLFSCQKHDFKLKFLSEHLKVAYSIYKYAIWTVFWSKMYVIPLTFSLKIDWFQLWLRC